MAKAKELRRHSVNYGYKSDAAVKFSYLVFLSGYEIFRAVSILSVAYNDLGVGLMLAIFSYLWVMVSPIQDIINFQYVLATAKATCKHINTVFEMELEPLVAEKTNPFKGVETVGIEVKNLSFSCIKDNPILENINLHIMSGSKVAIVGAIGSGKTTPSNVLVGFYPLDAGEIFYGGVSNRELKLSTIRENIHLILQHPKLFNDTMLFNLTLGKAYSDEAVQDALRSRNSVTP